MKDLLPRLWPKSLYAKTAVTLATATVLFLALTLITVGYLILVPVAKRSADDVAALMMLSAQTWAELPPQARPDFARELQLRHGLTLSALDRPLAAETKSLLPYVDFLQDSLTRRSGRTIDVYPSVASDGSQWIWTDIPTDAHRLHIGFPLDRLGPQPPLAAFIVLAVGIALVLLTALLLVRRLIRPLARFATAAQQVGRGVTPAPLPETGPTELVQLARTFNHMSLQVRELLADRTTMLSGIAHDLRTPLARQRLTLESMRASADPQLLAEATQDLEEMNRLIEQYLQLGQVLLGDSPETIDVRDIIDRCVIDARRLNTIVTWTPGDPCVLTLQPLVLARILANLLQNAVRYGEGWEVAVEYERMPAACIIRVLDRGPGIPEAEQEAVFRPFYRLETSRSSSTGGSGLGLAIARQLAQFHGWGLALESRPGGGTEARIEIPASGSTH